MKSGNKAEEKTRQDGETGGERENAPVDMHIGEARRVCRKRGFE